MSHLEPGAAAGDADVLADHAQGGNDTVRPIPVHQPGFHFAIDLYGDARLLSGHARGGDDLVTGEPSYGSAMYGDGLALLDHAWGGNDTLVGSPADEVMWGDAATVGPQARTGADVFVLQPGGGHDEIGDLEPQDRIDLSAFGFADADAVLATATLTGDGLLLTLDASSTVLLRSVWTVEPDSFLLG